MHKKLLSLFPDLRRYLILTVMLGLVGAGMTVIQMGLISRIVGGVVFAHENLFQVGTLLLLLLPTILVRAWLVWGREVVAQRGAIRTKGALRERLFALLLLKGPIFTRSERTGELAVVASEGIERLEPYVSRYLPQLFLSVLVPLLIVVSILFIDWISAVLMLITAPIIPLLMILIGSYAEKHIQHQWKALSRMSAHFLDVVQGLSTLKLFGRSKTQHQRIAETSEVFREKTMKALRYAFLSGMVLELLTTAAIGVIAVMSGVRLLNKAIPFENALCILLLAPDFYRPLRELGTHRHAGMEGKAAAQRLTELLETPPPFISVHESSRLPTGPLTITITNLTYTYPRNEHPTLKNINLTLPASTCTALIGQSGAGKSTLVNLLMRFMDASGGQITVNGIPLTELAPDAWRQLVALVPQHPYLFSGSIHENILLARPGASDQQVQDATSLAGAATFIDRFPQGYATRIGERGLRLSAGQAQRIAIARAFLKDAPLLILDEPTSHLDPESDLLIREALKQLVHSRTVLLITHRPSTISCAHQIATLENGTITTITSSLFNHISIEQVMAI